MSLIGVERPIEVTQALLDAIGDGDFGVGITQLDQ
jgi:hypothetical protein